MSYNYKSSNFLSTPALGDNRIRISDIYRNLKYSIEPDLSYFFISGNCVVIKITNENDIILTFKDNADALRALEKLSNVKDELGNSTETSIGDVEFTDLGDYDYMVYYGGKWVNTHDLVLPIDRYLYLGDWRISQEDGNLLVEKNTTGTTWELGGEFFV